RSPWPFKETAMDAIVAVDARWGIGRDGGLLFRISADLRRFKALTMGHTVVMGRRTLQSLPGGRGLPGRRNLVLSRQGDLAPEGAEVFCEVQPMLDAAGEDAFVIGGAQVYRLLLPACRRLYVTQIDADGGADVFFPEPAPELWRITEQSPWQEEQGLRYRYLTYERKDGTDGI
ncbi:MAG: dihydrofolate reductase, partial [Oscillospiraceae bacterium]|nr:dihydrofolate reductase [Oscillospiraceae bacterium]